MDDLIFMDDTIQFYEVDSSYIEYLSQFDSNVVQYKENRKYIGIMILLDDIKYVAPLTSNKNNTKEYLKKAPYRQVTLSLCNNNQELGFIRFGNMIPVFDHVLTKVDINSQQDEKYKYLLLKQYICITSPSCRENIARIVKRVLKIANNNNHYLHTVPGGICDIFKLIDKMEEYIDLTS